MYSPNYFTLDISQGWYTERQPRIQNIRNINIIKAQLTRIQARHQQDAWKGLNLAINP